jgi:undecaprenyl-diphosphatase
MMHRITHLGGVTATVLPGMVLLALPDTRLVGVAILLANLSSHLTVQILKRLVARPRPCDPSGRSLALAPLPDPFSFPSGHAAASMAVAGTVSLHAPMLAPGLLITAVLVAASRVTLRVHHPTDVLAGAALGLGGAALAHAVLF